MAARSRTFTVTTAALLAFGLAACAAPDQEPSDGGDVTTSPPSSPTAAPEPSDPAGAESPDPTDDAAGDDGAGDDGAGQNGEDPSTDVAFSDPATVAQADPSADTFLTVTGVRAATHADFDRVVFDLDGEGSAPGWRVEYVDEALDDGLGEPIDVAGGAVLQVRIAGTGIPADTGVEEYAGDPVDLGGAAIEQVVYRFVFEGYTTAFVGTAERAPFRVFTLSNPTRLVVDVQH